MFDFASTTARWHALDRAAKIEIGLSYLFRLLLLAGLVTAGIQGLWLMAFTIFLGLLCTFLPSLLNRNYLLTLPTEFEFLLTLFVYASIGLGEYAGFYTTFWWWDLVLHSGAGFGLGLVGFLILYSFYAKGMLRMHPLLIVVFSFAFSLALGVLWEIFEFSMDHIFLTTMQKSGLMDTMSDLIVDAMGALLISWIGYLHLKHCHCKGKMGIVDTLIHRFMHS